MLNYVWLALIVIGVFVAVAYDVNDFWQDTYRNGQTLEVLLTLGRPVSIGTEVPCTLHVSRKRFEDFYGFTGLSGDTLIFQGTFRSSGRGVGVLVLTVSEEAPSIWKEMAEVQGGTTSSLEGKATFARPEETGGNVVAGFVADPIKFVKLNRITNQGAIRHARIAVEIAIGLIGIMALWLGIMKIAEQSGLVGKIAMGLRPVMTRLFPDVPAEHPAMGAMIMNIAANVLGLANAATPLGLKAMEELNRLNKKVGTATDAMCTFLVINTSNVQLIPATVIAIRAASGSANPAEILGAVIVATSIATIVGVTTVKLLAKLPGYRKQLEEE
ncbi:MAG: nucleoside recognition domain-containing protein [Bacteroidota bacterium]